MVKRVLCIKKKKEVGNDCLHPKEGLYWLGIWAKCQQMGRLWGHKGWFLPDHNTQHHLVHPWAVRVCRIHRCGQISWRPGFYGVLGTACTVELMFLDPSCINCCNGQMWPYWPCCVQRAHQPQGPSGTCWLGEPRTADCCKLCIKKVRQTPTEKEKHIHRCHSLQREGKRRSTQWKQVL